MSNREYDLREDARSLVVGQWLRDGERLRSFLATARGNYRSAIKGHPSPVRRTATAAGWSVLKLLSPLGIVTGGKPYWNELKRFEGEPPPVIAFGDDRRCRAARELGHGPRRSGIWVLSHERFGFAADVRRSARPDGHPNALERRSGTFVVLERVIDVPSTQFEFEGEVAVGAKRTPYLRLRFHDGSGIDLRSRKAA